MRLLNNVLTILTRKDIHWLELLIVWITACFFGTLLAPGNYFASRPGLHHLENTVYGIYLSERFWSTIFGGMLVVQVFAIFAGDEAIGFQVTQAKKFALSPYLVRMRGLSISVGVWLSVCVLMYSAGQPWHVHLFWVVPVVLHVSLLFGICLGLGVFSIAGAIRMAAEVSVRRQDERREEVMSEATRYVEIFREVEAIHSGEMPQPQASK